MPLKCTYKSMGKQNLHISKKNQKYVIIAFTQKIHTLNQQIIVSLLRQKYSLPKIKGRQSPIKHLGLTWTVKKNPQVNSKKYWYTYVLSGFSMIIVYLRHVRSQKFGAWAWRLAPGAWSLRVGPGASTIKACRQCKITMFFLHRNGIETQLVK